MSAGRRFSLEAARRTREMSPNPPIFAPKNRPILSDSSPHVLMWDDLLIQFGNGIQRRQMINMLDSHLNDLGNYGIIVDVLLIGGSFVIRDLVPSDIDALIPYRLDPSCDLNQAIEFLRKPTIAELDLRYAPQDADVAIFVKMISFFTLLYSYDEITNYLSKPVFIVQR
jgi:hypothetical protein